MWHASAAGPALGRDELERRALRALFGVGDRSHEWREWTGRAFHVRRRLTEREQRLVGPAIDIRGTAEAIERLDKVRHILPPGYEE